MSVSKQEISSKITKLKKIKGLKNHNDIWELQKLIVTYSSALSIIDTHTDIKKLTTYLEPLEFTFKYYINLSSPKKVL